MPVSGRVIANTSVQNIIADEYLKLDIKRQIDCFNPDLAKRLDDTNFVIDPSKTINPVDTYNERNDNIITSDLYDYDIPWDEVESDETQDIDDLEEATLDKHIGTTFLLDPD